MLFTNSTNFSGCVIICLSAVLSSNAYAAELERKTVEYKHGDVTLEGYLVYDKSIAGQRPGVLVVHQWTGLSDYEKMRADQLAELGYLVFAADIYGQGVRPKVPAAAAEAGKYKKDRELLRGRVNAGLDQLRKHELSDDKRLAAIGYYFGGTTVLELARSGADLAGVVSFHGGLDSPNPADGQKIKAKLLVLHGADDPFVKTADIAAFEKELRDAKVDWQLVSYGNAVHSFTQKSAGNDHSKGAAYEARADRRSWEAMRAFFDELFVQK